jgi:hypothetical protein
MELVWKVLGIVIDIIFKASDDKAKALGQLDKIKAASEKKYLDNSKIQSDLNDLKQMRDADRIKRR